VPTLAAGQRCMATSAVVLVGGVDDERLNAILDAIVAKARALEVGPGMAVQVESSLPIA
jgi:acyl-CoA reductase-like NAD-dependent aldehyde dehydrogenase